MVAILCVHSDTILHLLAQTSLLVESRHVKLEAAVSSTLPMGVLLGKDIPE